ncbi:MAG: adenylate/guanylate cyclase domain-containing protein [Symploca sp. SIO1A3]|nr:adenylate/guanylate cyclase domain-containing protein [Symploca sp. SIO1A3]
MIFSSTKSASKLVNSCSILWRNITTKTKKIDLIIASLLFTGLLLGVRQLGWLQPLELVAFDLMVRIRPDEEPDPRLLVVGITEQDIEALGQYPISDAVLAQTLAKLSQNQPKIIGLDLARNIPIEPGYQSLVTQLQNPKILGITFIGNSALERVPPPPEMTEERIGYSDVLLDPDGVARRNSMYTSTDTNNILSLSLKLALAYLASYNISLQLTESQELQLGHTVFQPLLANSGGYQQIDDGDYQILLNYRSAHNIARQVTLQQVLKGQIEPSWVKDKIVLIGITAPTVNDLFDTPYSVAKTGNAQIPGVMLHAQMVSQILGAVLDNRPLFWYWSEWLELLWIALWSLLGGALVARSRHPLLLLLSGIAGVGCLWVCGMLLLLEGGWIPLAAPTLSFLLTGIIVGAYQLQQSKQQEQMVMRLLGQQTSPKIAQALWQERDRLLESGLLPGEILTATMLLTDLKGFSTISEKISPAVVMSWLNEYLAAMTQEVQQHQGIINKFTGDGILAVFGVPVPRTTKEEISEDAQQAVACALAISQRLESLNRNWETRGLPIVQMRVGIFTGPVMVGSLGSKERLEYGVIGDSVNIASRLESCEKHRQLSNCRILIAKETLVYLQEKFRVESWGSLSLKGKHQQIEVYRVLGNSDTIEKQF